MSSTFLYEVAILSYNRADIIREKTIKLLKKHNINPKRIRIFLETEALKEEYIKSIGNDYNYTITGQKGMLASRNFSRTYYHEEVDNCYKGVLMIDDDVEELNVLVSNKVEPVKNLDKTLCYMFNTTKELGFRLFAPCAYNNHFFMKDRVSINLKFCCGAFHGLIIDKSKPLLHTEIDQFEDSLMTMEHYLEDGGVVRFDNYSITTKFWEKKGGMCDIMGGMENRIINMNENAKYLTEKYPRMCSIKKKKMGDDIRLNSRFKM
tara:strand:- start:9 stop:797 length:789 start_codon:yes stop_codon:yes gene_type:complete